LATGQKYIFKRILLYVGDLLETIVYIRQFHSFFPSNSVNFGSFSSKKSFAQVALGLIFDVSQCQSQETNLKGFIKEC
jgi:hypothetical protein